MVLKPIKKKRLFEEIILVLEEYIKNEKLIPGDKLPSEAELSTIFEVSKTVVREAMSVLQAHDLIEKRAGSGIFLKEYVTKKTVGDRLVENLFEKTKVQEILEFRRGIEIEAVSLAALRATDKELQDISEAHENLIMVNKSGRIGLEEDFMFHYSIILAAHNTIYNEVFQKVATQFEQSMKASKLQSSKIPGRFEKAYHEHEEIVRALYKRDPQLAVEAMRFHLLQNEQKILVTQNEKKS